MHTTSNLEGSSRPLLAAKNRTLRQQFIQGHKNWTILEKKSCSDESQFLFQRSSSRVKIWHISFPTIYL